MIVGYIICQVVLLGVLLWGRFELHRFLRTHRGIDDWAALEKFKQVARLNMLATLAFLVFGVTLMVWGIYLATREGLNGLAVVIACSLPSILLAFGTRKIENRARSLECGDPALMAEYKRVSEIWVKKALPYF